MKGVLTLRNSYHLKERPGRLWVGPGQHGVWATAPGGDLRAGDPSVALTDAPDTGSRRRIGGFQAPVGAEE